MATSGGMPALVVTIVALVAGMIDAKKFVIPNPLTIALIVSGLAYHAAFGADNSLALSLAGVGFALGVLIVPYLVGALGAGDVKLMAGIGAWLGMPLTLYVFVVAAFATGLYSVAVLLWQGALWRAVATIQVVWLQLGVMGRHLVASERVEAVVKRDDRRQRLIPFGAMIALGVLVVVAWRMLLYAA